MTFSEIYGTRTYDTQSTQFDPYTFEIQSYEPRYLKQVPNSLSYFLKQNNDGVMSPFT